MMLRRLIPTVSSPLQPRALFSSSTSCAARYGFIGLGQMGYPMAKNIRVKIPADDSLTVFDVNAAATEQFKNEFPDSNVDIAADVSHLVHKSDTIITMLPQPVHVQSLFEKLVADPPPPSSVRKLFIDSSTIDVATSLETNKLVSECAALNASFVDAPVSGGVVGASAGTLSFLVGCSNEQFEEVSSVLNHMGERVFHCGEAGTGLAAKLANNYLLAVTNIAVAEAMNLGVKLGLDQQVLKEVINSSSGRCWSSEVNNPVDNELKDFEGGFGAALMKKDIGLARAAAVEVDARLELGEKVDQVYETVIKREGPKKDFSVVYQWLSQRGNDKFRKVFVKQRL